jgi:hypothetical protein
VSPAEHWELCPQKKDPRQRCICPDNEDRLVEEFQEAKPYVRTPRVPVSTPQGPYQSLATMIRAARTAGLLKPVQQYGGGRTPAPVP